MNVFRPAAAWSSVSSIVSNPWNVTRVSGLLLIRRVQLGPNGSSYKIWISYQPSTLRQDWNLACSLMVNRYILIPSWNIHTVNPETMLSSLIANNIRGLGSISNIIQKFHTENGFVRPLYVFSEPMEVACNYWWQFACLHCSHTTITTGYMETNSGVIPLATESAAVCLFDHSL